jgi:hypothetical protein
MTASNQHQPGKLAGDRHVGNHWTLTAFEESYPPSCEDGDCPSIRPNSIPEGFCSFDGATTSHRTPASVNARHNPKPLGPAS